MEIGQKFGELCCKIVELSLPHYTLELGDHVLLNLALIHNTFFDFDKLFDDLGHSCSCDMEQAPLHANRRVDLIDGSMLCGTDINGDLFQRSGTKVCLHKVQKCLDGIHRVAGSVHVRNWISSTSFRMSDYNCIQNILPNASDAVSSTYAANGSDRSKELLLPGRREPKGVAFLEAGFVNKSAVSFLGELG